MREILFRGKDIDTCNWVYGSYNDVYEVITNEHDNFDIDVYTLGQYIGLRDKNSTMIFEDDIIKGTTFHGLEVIGVVHATMIDGAKLQQRDTDVPWHLSCFYEIEVIGNIYDNPELLEVDNGK